jgi:ATPase subunit of ABC transporter with duplicated ATPase domains
VVSHDRAFLQRCVDDVVVIEESGRAGRLPGGYEAWEADRRSRRTSGTLRAKPSATAAGPVGGAAPAARTTAGGPSLSTLRNQLRQVEKDIAARDRKRSQLETTLAAAADHREMATIGAALAEVVGELGALEDRWLELGVEIEARG